MKAFIVLCLAATAAAHWIDQGHGHGHHIPSGSVGVGKDGALIAGPSGSIHTDNGIHGHGAGARLSGPAGDVRTHGGHVTLHGPGIGHHDGGHWGGHDDGQWHGGNDDGQWHGGHDDGQWRGNHGHDDGQWHGDGHHGHGHHIPSGSIGVGKDGALIAGPAGSIHTDNGIHGHGAGARLSGPAGDVRTHGGHVTLHGPGIGHHDDGHWGGHHGW